MDSSILVAKMLGTIYLWCADYLSVPFQWSSNEWNALGFLSAKVALWDKQVQSFWCCCKKIMKQNDGHAYPFLRQLGCFRASISILVLIVGNLSNALIPKMFWCSSFYFDYSCLKLNMIICEVLTTTNQCQLFFEVCARGYEDVAVKIVALDQGHSTK